MNFWMAGKAPLLALFYQMSDSSEFIFFFFEKEIKEVAMFQRQDKVNVSIILSAHMTEKI